MDKSGVQITLSPLKLHLFKFQLFQFSKWPYSIFRVLAVRAKESHLDKSGSTGIAVVGLFPRVDAGVGLQVGWPVELGSAHIAAIRLLSCRGHHRQISRCTYTNVHNHWLDESHSPRRLNPDRLHVLVHVGWMSGIWFAYTRQPHCINLHNGKGITEFKQDKVVLCSLNEWVSEWVIIYIVSIYLSKRQP